MTAYHVGQVTGRMIPQIGATFSIPDALVDTARGRAVHAEITRRAAREAMIDHHHNVMPGHFQQTNRSKYDHKERSKAWKRNKRRRFHSITDLKASGRSRQLMLAAYPRIQFRGRAGDVMTAFMRYRWPFPKPGKQNPRRVTIEDMNRELAAWTFEDIVRASEVFRDTFVEQWVQEMQRRPRWKKKIEPKLNEI